MPRVVGEGKFSPPLRRNYFRAVDEVLIEENLQKFLLKQYEKEGLTVIEAKSIILQLKTLPLSDLYESNKTFIKMLSDGFILKRENRSKKDIYIQLIDYKGLEKQRSPHADQAVHVVVRTYPPL